MTAYAKSGKQLGEAKAKLGTGGRFAALQGSVASEYVKKGINPKKAATIGAAVAAKQGVKKYGAKKMTKLAVAGKRQAAAPRAKA